MAIVVLRLDAEQVSAPADCVAHTLDQRVEEGREQLEKLLSQLRARQANSKHSSEWAAN